MLFIRYIKAEDAEEEMIREAAAKTIASALRLTNLFEFDELSRVENIEKLKGTPIYELMTVFISGNLDGYRKWEASHKAELDKFGEFRRRMKMLLRAHSLTRKRAALPQVFPDIVLRLPTKSDRFVLCSA